MRVQKEAAEKRKSAESAEKQREEEQLPDLRSYQERDLQELHGAVVNCSHGLKWKKAGSEKPLTSTEIKNLALATALQGKDEFTDAEWDTFNLPASDLSYNSYVKVDDSYFKPSGYNPLYWLPTGGGKTVVMVALVVGLASEGKCSLIIVHRNEIFDQFESTLKKFGCNPAVIAQKRVYEKGLRIVLAMIQTLEKRWIPRLTRS